MTAFRHSIASVAALLVSVAFLLAGNGLLSTLLPLRAQYDLFTNSQIGIVGSSYFLGFTLGCLTGALLIERVGHIRTYLALVSVASAAALVHAMSSEPVVWWVARLISGYCLAVLFVTIESWLNERADNQTRGVIFSVYMVINLAVGACGPLMVALGDVQNFVLFSFGSILLSLAAVPVAMTRSQSPTPVPFVIPRLGRFYAKAPAACVGGFAVGLANGAFTALGPVFALRSGLDAAGAGLFVAAALLGGAAGQWPLGWLSDRLDRRLVIISAGAVCAVAGLVLGYLNQGDPPLLLMLGFGFGLCAFPLYSLCVAHANDLSAESDYIETSGAILLVYGTGAVLGPILASTLVSVWGDSALFAFTAAVHALLVVFVAWRVRSKAPVAEEEKVEFREAIVAAQIHTPYEMAPSEPQEREPAANP